MFVADDRMVEILLFLYRLMFSGPEGLMMSTV